jgi:hypothetical protein
MRKWLILLSALTGTTASSAPAWTWVDANGTVHFSDTPVPGARQIEIAGAQGFGSQAPAAQSARRPTTATDTQAAYRSVEVVSPAEQETLWNIGTMLTVQLSVQPELQTGHRYDVVLDGQRRNMNTTAARVVVPDVFRGTHTLQAVVIDSAGRELMRSSTRTFFVQQTSLRNPNSSIVRPAPAAN